MFKVGKLEAENAQLTARVEDRERTIKEQELIIARLRETVVT
jgi:hypothetical protein